MVGLFVPVLLTYWLDYVLLISLATCSPQRRPRAIDSLFFVGGVCGRSRRAISRDPPRTPQLLSGTARRAPCRPPKLRPLYARRRVAHWQEREWAWNRGSMPLTASKTEDFDDRREAELGARAGRMRQARVGARRSSRARRPVEHLVSVTRKDRKPRAHGQTTRATIARRRNTPVMDHLLRQRYGDEFCKSEILRAQCCGINTDPHRETRGFGQRTDCYYDTW